MAGPLPGSWLTVWRWSAGEGQVDIAWTLGQPRRVLHGKEDRADTPDPQTKVDGPTLPPLLQTLAVAVRTRLKTLLDRLGPAVEAGAECQRLREQYLTLMQDILTNRIYEDPPCKAFGRNQYDVQLRERGLDWPSTAHTMIGSSSGWPICAIW